VCSLRAEDRERTDEQPGQAALHRADASESPCQAATAAARAATSGDLKRQSQLRLRRPPARGA
jgi:hypothetical protein